MTASTLTKEELETPKRAKDFRKWVDEKLMRLASTPEGRRAVRFRKGLVKELVEESLPAAIFSDNYYKRSRCVVLQHVLGSQNYDVAIKDKRLCKRALEYLEITQAHEGETEHLRMIKLEERGHVSRFGSVFKAGTKNTGIAISIDNQAISHDELVERELHLICGAAKRKSKKRYPKNTGLVIVCDDSICFRKAQDVSILKKYMLYGCLNNLSNFSNVFIVGWSSHLFLGFKTT